MEWRYFRGKIVKSRLLKKSPQKLYMQSLGKKSPQTDERWYKNDPTNGIKLAVPKKSPQNLYPSNRPKKVTTKQEI